MQGWAEWVRAGRVAAVPGALTFPQAAHARGVAVFFVSNRAAADEDSTLANLRSLGIEASGDTILSPGEHGWTPDKSARRAYVTERYRVLLLVGDDLGDLVSVSKLAPVHRVAVADRYADRWLERWVVLPNPSYGSWSRALTAGVSSDSDVLARKFAAVRGYR